MNRIQLMKIHALLAAFIFPVAVMFFATGALYTWGIKGSYSNEVYEISLDQPLQKELSSLTALAQAELGRLEMSEPSGKPKIKTSGPHYVLEWTGAAKDLVLEPTANPLLAKLTVKHTTWFRHLVQLHKAKGGEAFKVYAAVLALSLAGLLLSGFIMAWQSPALKRASVLSFAAGVGTFFVFLFLS